MPHELSLYALALVHVYNEISLAPFNESLLAKSCLTLSLQTRSYQAKTVGTWVITQIHSVRSLCLITAREQSFWEGGAVDVKDRYIEQTFTQVDSLDNSTIANEAFGPVCAIFPVNNVD